MDLKYLAANYVKNMFSEPFSRRVKYTKIREKSKLRERFVMYESFFGSNVSDNPLAIFKYLLEHDSDRSYTHVWVLDDFEDNGYYDYYSKFSNVKFVKPHSTEYYKYLSICKFIVYNVTLPPYFIRKSGQIIINTWHGTPLKTLGLDMEGEVTQNYNVQRNFLLSDYILSPNRFTTDKLIKSYGIDGIYQGKVLEGGYPRIDQIYGQTQTPVLDRTLDELHFDESKQTVLYAPTWRGITGTVENTIEDVAKRIHSIASKVNLDKYQILVKVHPQMAQYMGKETVPGVTFVPAWLDASELLAKVDILITDYSSVFFDYLVANKPVIFYMYDRAEYTKTRGVYFDLDQLPGASCSTATEVAEAITHSERIRPAHQAIIDQFKREFVSFDDGKVTERYIEQIFHQQQGRVKTLSFSNNRENVVAYSGALLNNGITSSLLNLSHNFDYEHYNLIIFDKNKGNDDFAANAKRFDKRAHVLFRGDGINLTYPEWIVYHRLFNTQDVSEVDRHRFFVQREWHRLLGLTGIDVAIDFSGYNSFWTYLMAFSGAKRRVVYQHNDMAAEYKKSVLGENVHHDNLSIIFQLYRYFDYIACVGKYTLELNRKNLTNYTRPDQFQLVQNSLDENFLFKHRKEQQLRITTVDQKKYLMLENEHEYGHLIVNAITAPTQNGKNFINIGRLSPEKGQERLIRAFKQLVSQTKENHQLYLVGEGMDEDELKLLVMQLELENQVIFVGQTTAALELLDLCDCFVFSSTHEGQPMTLLECLALQKPIVATKIPGNESVLSGTEAMIVPDSQAGILAGMYAYLNGEVKVSEFNVKTYNQAAIQQFDSMLK